VFLRSTFFSEQPSSYFQTKENKMTKKATLVEDIHVSRGRGIQWNMADLLALIRRDIKATGGWEQDAAQFEQFAVDVSFIVLAYYARLSQRIREAFTGRRIAGSRPEALNEKLGDVAAATTNDASAADEPERPAAEDNKPDKKDTETASTEKHHTAQSAEGKPNATPKVDETIIASGREIAAMFAAAEYTPLTSRLYELALETDYEFQVPSGTEWAKLDCTALPALYDALRGDQCTLFRSSEAVDPTEAEEYTSAETTPHFARHILVVVRGAHVEERTEFFFRQKADMITERFWRFLAHVVGKATGLVAGKPRGATVETWINHWLGAPGATDAKACKKAPKPEEDGDATTAHEPTKPHRTRVHRKTIRTAIEEKGLLRGLLTNATALEPCFDSVIVMYRDSGESEDTQQRERDAKKQARHDDKEPQDAKVIDEGCTGRSVKGGQDPVQQTTQEPWQLFAYRDVPFGDLEVILPHKTLGLLPIDVVKTFIGIILLLVALHYSLSELFPDRSGTHASDLVNASAVGAQSSSYIGATIDATMGAVDVVQDEFSWVMGVFIAVSVIATIIGHIITLVFNYMTTITYYENSIRTWLLGKRISSGRDVITKLVDEVQSQDAAEIILAYYVLFSRNNESLTGEELKHEVERLLASAADDTTPSNRTEFDLPDAIWKLRSLDLVHVEDGAEDGITRYSLGRSLTEFQRDHPVAHLRDLQIRNAKFAPPPS
jgi:hypothetical protein